MICKISICNLIHRIIFSYNNVVFGFRMTMAHITLTFNAFHSSKRCSQLSNQFYFSIKMYKKTPGAQMKPCPSLSKTRNASLISSSISVSWISLIMMMITKKILMRQMNGSHSLCVFKFWI